MRTSFGMHPGRAFTLVEVVMASAISMTMLSAAVYGYVQTTRRAEWSGYSLAAHSLAVQRIEQARACKWDPMGLPAVDELVSTNFGPQVNLLDIPFKGTNIVYATNYTTITSLSTNPNLKMIRVDCVWKFMNKGPFSNSIVTFRASDQ